MKKKLVLASFLLTNSKNTDPENAYRKPPVILKIVPEAGKFRSLLSSWNIHSDEDFGTVIRIS
jgi:hypothetical protein